MESSSPWVARIYHGFTLFCSLYVVSVSLVAVGDFWDVGLLLNLVPSGLNCTSTAFI